MDEKGKGRGSARKRSTRSRKLPGEAKENREALMPEVGRGSEAFRLILYQLPFPMEVFSPDGTAVMVNRALLEESGIPSAELVVGKYNILNDPTIEEAGIRDYVVKAFSGQSVYIPEVKVPLRRIERVYGVKNDGISSVYQGAVLFPVFDDVGELSQVAVILRNRHIYNVRENIDRAIEFLRGYFHKDYCLEEVAEVANLSPYHFIRVFKEQTGKTPYEYLLEVKIEKAKEMLKTPQKTVTEVCLACGFASPSHFSSVFKKIAGISPSEYRKNC